jgi:CBS domain containing-hemolysin-like protein
VSLLAILLLTLLTGYFVAQEFSYVAADRGALREQAADGDAAAEKALRVTGRLSFMLSGAQLGITVTTLLVGLLAEPAIADAIRPALGFLPPSMVSGVAVAIGVALATLLQMILGELAPKNLGIARPEPVAKFLAPSTLVYLKVAGPLIKLFDTAAARLVRLAGIEPIEELEEGATPEELSRIVTESATAGELPPRLADLLVRALEFGDRTAEDVMIPRTRVVSLRAAGSVEELLEAVRVHGHSRYPVLGEDPDDVAGVVGLLELIRAGDTAAWIGDLAKPPLLVPTTLGLPALLERMGAAREAFACVIDEYGGLAGVVTGEDLAEELVGELVDENDPEPLGVRANADGSWDVPGTLRLDEVARATGVRLPESEDYETIAGLVLASLGRIADPGEMTTVPVVDEPGLLDLDDREPHVALLTVLKVERHVPAWLRLALGAADPAEDDADRPEMSADYPPELFSALFQGGVA